MAKRSRQEMESSVKFANEHKAHVLAEHVLQPVYDDESITCLDDRECHVRDALDACPRVTRVDARLLKDIRPGDTWEVYVMDFCSEMFVYDPAYNPDESHDATTPSKLIKRTMKKLKFHRPSSDRIVNTNELDVDYRGYDEARVLPSLARESDLVFIDLVEEASDGEVTEFCIGIKYVRDLELWAERDDSEDDGLGVFHYNSAWTFLDFDFTLR